MTFTTESKAQNFMVVLAQNVPGITDISDIIASTTFADLTMLRNSNLATLTVFNLMTYLDVIFTISVNQQM